MKKLIVYDPQTGKPKTAATITLKDGKVEFDPKEAPSTYTMLKSLVVKGKEVLPKDGKRYYDGLDGLGGTFYAIVDGD